MPVCDITSTRNQPKNGLLRQVELRLIFFFYQMFAIFVYFIHRQLHFEKSSNMTAAQKCSKNANKLILHFQKDSSARSITIITLQKQEICVPSKFAKFLEYDNRQSIFHFVLYFYFSPNEFPDDCIFQHRLRHFIREK